MGVCALLKCLGLGGGKKSEVISKVLGPELRKWLGWWSSNHIICSKLMELLAPKAISVQAQRRFIMCQ